MKSPSSSAPNTRATIVLMCSTANLSVERGAKMVREGGQKMDRPVLRVVDGGAQPKRTTRVLTTAEIRLDAEMQQVIGAIRGTNGRVPHRGFRRVRYYEAFPWRVLARWIVQAHRAGAPPHQLKAIVACLDRFVDGLSDRRSQAA